MRKTRRELSQQANETSALTDKTINESSLLPSALRDIVLEITANITKVIDERLSPLSKS